VAWFNALPLAPRARLVDLDGRAGERCVAAEQGWGARHSRELPGRWGWMIAGGLAALLGGAAGLFGLARWGSSVALWGGWAGPLWVLGGAAALAGLAALWRGWRLVEQVETPFRHRALLTPTHLVKLGEMVRVEALGERELPLEERLVKIREWSASRDRGVERQARRWVLRAGALEVSYARREEAAQVLAAHAALRRAAQADAARGAPWPALLEGWPEDAPTGPAPPAPTQGPAVRTYRASGTGPWPAALLAMLWLVGGAGILVARGVLREREARDEILAGAPQGDCALYARRGGVLYRGALRKVCVPQLLQAARYQAGDRRGHAARETLELLEVYDPGAARGEEARRVREQVARCVQKWESCP
jgi:hypothetical protein